MSRTQITKEFIPIGKKNRPGTKMSPSSITIHNTDNPKAGADAAAHSSFVRNTGYYIHKGKKIWVSWHFTVDDSEIIQQLPLDEVSYHAGSAANASSIAIEICMNADGDLAAANVRAARLVASLLTQFGWTVDELKKHQDWTGKKCPSQLLSDEKWENFKDMVRDSMEGEMSDLAIDPDEIESAGSERQETFAEDFDIDHDHLMQALLKHAGHLHEASGEGLSSTFVGESFGHLISALAQGADIGEPRLFFPKGINEIEFTADESGVTVNVRGPRTEAAPAISEQSFADEFEGDVPEDDDDAAVPFSALPPIATYLNDTNFVYGTHSPAYRYGVALTIEVLNDVAEKYFEEFGVRLGIGDISKKGGGTIPGHKSHKKGVDVDVRVPRKDNEEKASNWKEPSYSRARTQYLVNLFRNNGKFPIKYIFFNDPNVSGVSYYKKHDNHLHVRFDLTRLLPSTGM